MKEKTKKIQRYTRYNECISDLPTKTDGTKM